VTCHNCGIPEKTYTNPGRTITIVQRAENGFQRNRKTTVWVCCNNCAHQAMAVSKYGPASFRWPISLEKFKSVNTLEAS